MLVLTRRPGQSIRIGANVEIRVVRVEGDRVVLGIAAPRHVAVVRAELVEEVSGEVRDALDTRARLRVMLTPHAQGEPAGGSSGHQHDAGSDDEGPGIA